MASEEATVPLTCMYLLRSRNQSDCPVVEVRKLNIYRMMGKLRLKGYPD